MESDIQIAQKTELLPILEIAKKLSLGESDIELYGKYKAKINCNVMDEQKANAKIILVTAISPTPAGEGKTTTTVGLGDALSALNKKTIVCLREPSLGPVFGVKGGAAGGGYAQVVPMEDINLHFTGDLHAISAANNLLAAMLDNHIYQGNALNIDPRRIFFKRVVDMNDRQLRFITDGLGGKINGFPREDGFDITVASEIMAVFCLSESLIDLKNNLSKISLAYTYDNKIVTCGDLKAEGALTALLKDAFKPNLVQTLEKTPAIIHGGPFANIAHGCNSVIATKTAAALADYVVTEAGFGAELGAEKFFDIKCRKTGIRPSAVVIVVTVRALKFHGSVKKEDLNLENTEALLKGIENLKRHLDNIKNVFNMNAVVAINKFPADTENEIEVLFREMDKIGVKVSISEVFEKGSDGGLDLAKKVLEAIEIPSELKFAYEDGDKLTEKIEKVAKRVYRAKAVNFSPQALRLLNEYQNSGFGNLPVCIAKTQYSFSDNPNLLGAPADFEINIKNVKLSSGAGFIVVLTGDIMTMPGLPKNPAAEKIDVDENGKISGLF